MSASEDDLFKQFDAAMHDMDATQATRNTAAYAADRIRELEAELNDAYNQIYELELKLERTLFLCELRHASAASRGIYLGESR